MNYLPFNNARKYVRSLKLRNRGEWTEFCKSEKKPPNIPKTPNSVYKKAWDSWGDWLGTNRIAPINKKFLPFSEARAYAHRLGLKTYGEWIAYRSSNKKPNNIPASPPHTYKSDWISWGDWLGTGYIATTKREYLSFFEARKIVHELKLKNKNQWKAYCLSRKASNIPSRPDHVYQENWKDWGDWLGSGFVSTNKREYLPFTKARNYVHKLKLKSIREWKNYTGSQKFNAKLPFNPDKTYKNQWKSWGDWLGTGTVATYKMKFLPYNKALKLVRSLKIKSLKEWYKFCKSGTKPSDLPSNPNKIYKNDWVSYGHWLGTGTIAPQNREYMSFREARESVRKFGLTKYSEWQQLSKSGNLPSEIPTHPAQIYKNEWVSMPDWLGYVEKNWSTRKIKSLLRDLISSRIIYTWDEAVLYSLLLRKGLLNLGPSNRHHKFFKNLMKAIRSEHGKQAIENYVNSNSSTPPDLTSVTKSLIDISQEVPAATDKELTTNGDDEPLEYTNSRSVQEILSHTDALESINVDEEAIQFYIDYSVDELWRAAFKNEHKTVRKLEQVGKNGNEYHDTVIDTFLKDYEGSTKLEIPSGYSFPYTPTLMQRYVAYKITTLPYFGNFSSTGTGKTLSAILASRTIYSKITIIVCPNDVVEQWKRNILETFPNSKVITGKAAFDIRYSENEFQYAVLNYDKFSQEESPNHILKLVKQTVDFVILDEIHFTKIRNEEALSQRRKNLDGLMTGLRNKNPDIKVLGLSATPVVNNLREGKSLLELISGKLYDDVAVRPTIPNAVTLYEKLSTISIRELPSYSIDINTHVTNVSTEKPPNLPIRVLKSNPLAIEKFLTDARVPEIVKLIEGQTIIYTEYVEDIIQNLSTAVQNAGYSYALYTGFDRSGLTRFLNKEIQVLIASRPLSVGVDGLQHICNRLIINTLPWTNAQYQQLIGRLIRKGQVRDIVNVYLVKASIGGYQYDDLKWKRILFKRTLADCAVDGRLPEKNLVTPEQAAMEAIRWLERLERGEISTVVRRDLNVQLTSVEIKKRIIQYGDFTKLNNKINNESSPTTNLRMLNDPKEWEEYHRQYRDARKNWSIIPYEEIIKRIKQLSPRLLIGDFGCGEAKILEAFGQNRVYSFDHVAINNNVTACDMRNTGLPDEAVDIAIFSLSLMGRNWQDYIKEAKRCLATNGYLLIAETTKSMKGRLSKIIQVIQKHGFDIYNVEERGDFTFIEAREL